MRPSPGIYRVTHEVPMGIWAVRGTWEDSQVDALLCSVPRGSLVTLISTPGHDPEGMATVTVLVGEGIVGEVDLSVFTLFTRRVDL